MIARACTLDDRVIRVMAVAVLLACSVVWGARTGNGDGGRRGAGSETIGSNWPKEWKDVEQRANNIVDLIADFEEHKFTALLKKPLTSRGRVKIMDGHVLWETAEPHKSTLAIDGKHIQIHYPKRSVVEVYDIDKRLQTLAVSPLPRLDVLARHFDFEAIDPEQVGTVPGRTGGKRNDGESSRLLALRLTPTSEYLFDYIDRIEIVIDRATACLLRAEMTDPDGDRTVMLFSHFQTNTGLKESDVTLHLPPGTEVVRPLAGQAGAAHRSSNEAPP